MEKLVIGIGVCSAVMSLVSFFYIALSQLLKKIWSAKSRYYLWLFVLTGFLTPFKPSIGKPVYEVEVTMNASPVPGENEQTSAWFLLSVIWMLGMVIMTVYYVYKHYQFKKHINRFAKLCDEETYIIAEATAKQMGIQQLKVVILPGFATPMMTGFRVPTIMLPEKIYSKAELRLIIKHEVSHFKRRDLLYKIFVLICRIVHWFNPFMPLIVRHIECECELACDEIVINGESRDNKKLYCQAILTTVTAGNESGSSLRPVIASNFGRRKSYLGYRLRMIISSDGKKSLAVVCLIVILAVAFSGTVVAITYSKPDESDLVDNDEIDNFTVTAVSHTSSEKTSMISVSESMSTEGSATETVKTTSKTKKDTTTAESETTCGATTATAYTTVSTVISTTEIETSTTTTTRPDENASDSDISSTTAATVPTQPDEEPTEGSASSSAVPTATTCTTVYGTTVCTTATVESATVVSSLSSQTTTATTEYSP